MEIILKQNVIVGIKANPDMVNEIAKVMEINHASVIASLANNGKSIVKNNDAMKIVKTKFGSKCWEVLDYE